MQQPGRDDHLHEARDRLAERDAGGEVARARQRPTPRRARVTTTSTHCSSGEEERRAGVVVGVERALHHEQHRERHEAHEEAEQHAARRRRPRRGLSVKMRDAGTAATARAAVATTTNRPRVRMLRPMSARTSSSRPAAACSLSCVKYGVPIDSTMIEYGSMKSSQAFCDDEDAGVALAGCRGQDARLHEPGELPGDDHQERPARRAGRSGRGRRRASGSRDARAGRSGARRASRMPACTTMPRVAVPAEQRDHLGRPVATGVPPGAEEPR